tara:strand:+ start:3830 stop:5740 length:1911 start_codon:yes stop_codon:yes gene_type:complete
MEKKTRLKILIVSQYFWPENFRINDLVNYFKNKNLDIEILTGKPNYPGGQIYDEFKKNPDKFKEFNEYKIYRVPVLNRGSGSNTRLLLNYISFLLSSIFFGIFYFRKKNFDYIFTFGTSPLTVAITSLILAKLCKSKTILWVLDLWPEIIFDLGIFKSIFLKKILSKIIQFILNKTDIILAQSENYVELIKKKIINKDKVFFLPSWPEIQAEDDTSIEIFLDEIKDDYLNIFFTGSVGDAQNYRSIVSIINQTKNKKIKWYIIGGGRRFKELVKLKTFKDLYNLKLIDHIPLTTIIKYQKKADILFLSLKKGEALSATIPGKFSTYLKFKKPILGLIAGETNKLINDYNVGVAFDPDQEKELIKKLDYFIDLKKKDSLDSTFINHDELLLKFDYEKNLDRFYEILTEFNYEELKNINLIKNISDDLFKKNFVLSGLNLAFLSHYMANELDLHKDLYHWPDGLFKRFVYKEKIEKIPGRDILSNLQIPTFIDSIHILGNADQITISYLKNKFKKEIIYTELPIGNIENIIKAVPKIDKDSICILTLPTPKQEQVAQHIVSKNINYKILCIGGALNMLTGKEKPCPKFLENYGLETIWRLRTDTFRRTSRLFKTIILFILHGIILRKIKSIKTNLINN